MNHYSRLLTPTVIYSPLERASPAISGRPIHQDTKLHYVLESTYATPPRWRIKSVTMLPFAAQEGKEDIQTRNISGDSVISAVILIDRHWRKVGIIFTENDLENCVNTAMWNIFKRIWVVWRGISERFYYREFFKNRIRYLNIIYIYISRALSLCL